MPSLDPADTMPEDDLTIVSADSESRDVATRRSKAHKKYRLDRRRARKASESILVSKEPSRTAVWQRSEHDLTICSQYMHFAEQLRCKSSAKTCGHLTPIPLESFPFMKLPKEIREKS